MVIFHVVVFFSFLGRTKNRNSLGGYWCNRNFDWPVSSFYRSISQCIIVGSIRYREALSLLQHQCHLCLLGKTEISLPASISCTHRMRHQS